MIIIAVAVILSLSGSDIISKENESKTKNDVANARELASRLYDWSQQKANLDWWTAGLGLSFTQAFEETIPSEIINSIKANGEIYIGRYEAGVLSGGSTSVIDGTQNQVSIKGVTVWNNIPWDADYAWDGTCGNAENNGCVKVSKSLTTSAVESHLIYGTEWTFEQYSIHFSSLKEVRKPFAL